MKKTTCTIFKVYGSLSTNRGWNHNIVPMTVEETNKSFVTTGYRISKDKLMKIDTDLRDNTKLVAYYTYCREGDQRNALNLIKKQIISKVKQYKDEVDILCDYTSKTIIR